MSWPFVDDNSWDQSKPLKYVSGDEKPKTVVVDRTTVTADSDGRRRLTGGTLLTKITASGKYGPYLKTASDGRQTISENSAVVLWRGEDFTLGNKSVGGLFADCVFDISELTLGGVSQHGTPWSTLTAAFPQCVFDD